MENKLTKDFWSGEEWIPVTILSESTGVLEECSINPEFGYKDMVLLDFLNSEILQVLKKKSNTIFLSYDIPYFGEITKNWKIIKEYFEKQKLHIQKHVEGVFFLSVPISYGKEKIKELIEKCPITCFEITQNDSSDDFDDEDDDMLHLN